MVKAAKYEEAVPLYKFAIACDLAEDGSVLYDMVYFEKFDMAPSTHCDTLMMYFTPKTRPWRKDAKKFAGFINRDYIDAKGVFSPDPDVVFVYLTKYWPETAFEIAEKCYESYSRAPLSAEDEKQLLEHDRDFWKKKALAYEQRTDQLISEERKLVEEIQRQGYLISEKNEKLRALERRYDNLETVADDLLRCLDRDQFPELSGLSVRDILAKVGPLNLPPRTFRKNFADVVRERPNPSGFGMKLSPEELASFDEGDIHEQF